MRILLWVGVLLCACVAKAETVDITLRTQFVFGKAEVTKRSQQVLDQLYQVMVDFPTAQALITGHSDNIGKDYSNKFLSQKRALFISDYLIKRGIAPERLISKGVGSVMPIASNTTEAGREKNRRVDIEFSNLTPNMASALKETVSVLPTMAKLKKPSLHSNTWQAESKVHYRQPTNTPSPATAPKTNNVDAPQDQSFNNKYLPKSLTLEMQSQLEVDPLQNIGVASNTTLPDREVSAPVVQAQTEVASSPARVSSDEDRPFAKAGNFIRYKLGIGGYYNSLHVENQVGPGTADWISKINYNAEAAIQWSLTSSQSTWMGIRVSGHKQDYEHNNAPSLYSWDGEAPDLFRAALMFDFESTRFGFGLDFEVNEEAFLYENAFLVTIEKNKVFGLATRLKYKILAEDSHSARLGLDVSYAVGGVEDAVKDIIKETKAKDRLSYVGYLDFRTKDIFKEHELGVKFYYGLRSFANEHNLQEEEIVGLLFTLYSPAWL
ncbi:MAG: OmpA family protein [Bdellovibrionaceae bacterium]|nr:OmpA family protein [Pseudobdellovibrionaceae bacterium]